MARGKQLRGPAHVGERAEAERARPPTPFDGSWVAETWSFVRSTRRFAGAAEESTRVQKCHATNFASPSRAVRRKERPLERHRPRPGSTGASPAQSATGRSAARAVASSRTRPKPTVPLQSFVTIRKASHESPIHFLGSPFRGGDACVRRVLRVRRPVAPGVAGWWS